jgi:hypothetical protein
VHSAHSRRSRRVGGIMDKKLFAELVDSMKQMNEIVRGKRTPSREFIVDAIRSRSCDLGLDSVSRNLQRYCM